MIERWDRVTAIFGAARSLDGVDRESFLSVACSGDADLRVEVEKLLAADVPDDAFLERAPWSAVVPPLATILTPGQVLRNRYRVEAELAAGGQALVYRAMDELLNRPVVIKVMRAEGRGNQWLKRRFEQEMRVLATIDHPGVVGIIDVGELEDSSPFLVIQFISGRSLREALADGPLSPPRVSQIIRQMASALCAAHAAGIAHRDLKPENVMLHSHDGAEETARLIDFGIAKISRDDLAPGTTTIVVAGTVRYMAPEQLEGKHASTSDIYSMALVVCEMLSGHPDIRMLPRWCPARARDALSKALAYRPDDHPADLRAWSQELASTLQSSTPHRRWVVGVAAALLVLVVGGFTAVQMLRGLEEPVLVVEKVGGHGPSTEGFKVDHDVTGRIVANESRTGFDAWRVITRDQGHYYRPLTKAQKQRAVASGWRATAVMKVESGQGGIVIDFAGAGRRFDVQVYRDDEREFVRLNRQLVPDSRGMEFDLPRSGAFHEYELIYDPDLKVADLWIDKVRRLTGYAGHTQFQEDKGLLLGANVFKSDSGSMVFRSVRLEINP